jgi:hypothetical protein
VIYGSRCRRAPTTPRARSGNTTHDIIRCSLRPIDQRRQHIATTDDVKVSVCGHIPLVVEVAEDIELRIHRLLTIPADISDVADNTEVTVLDNLGLTEDDF